MNNFRDLMRCIDRSIRIYHIIAFQHTVFFLEGFKHTTFVFSDAIFLVFVTVLFPQTSYNDTFCYLFLEYTYRLIGPKKLMTTSASVSEI